MLRRLREATAAADAAAPLSTRLAAAALLDDDRGHDDGSASYADALLPTWLRGAQPASAAFAHSGGKHASALGQSVSDEAIDYAFLLGITDASCPAATDAALAAHEGLTAALQGLSLRDAQALLASANPHRFVPWGSFIHTLLQEVLAAYEARLAPIRAAFLALDRGRTGCLDYSSFLAFLQTLCPGTTPSVAHSLWLAKAGVDPETGDGRITMTECVAVATALRAAMRTAAAPRSAASYAAGSASSDLQDLPDYASDLDAALAANGEWADASDAVGLDGDGDDGDGDARQHTAFDHHGDGDDGGDAGDFEHHDDDISGDGDADGDSRSGSQLSGSGGGGGRAGTGAGSDYGHVTFAA